MPEHISSSELLAVGGLFDRQWSAFTPRDGQQQMAGLIEQALAEPRKLVIEAPSGSGKTIAYLLPIIIGNKRALISTASRYLQNQLFRQDIPRIQQLLGSSRTVAMLQGRSHYLCPYYLLENMAAKSGLALSVQKSLQAIAQRYKKTAVGELDRLAPNLDFSLRPYLTSTSDDCLGRQCPQYNDCPLMLARDKAQQADMIIINHSLMFSDQMLRREQLGSVLPDRDVVVVDEAHRLADFAQPIITLSLPSHRLSVFLRDTRKALRKHAPEQRQLLNFIEQLLQAVIRIAALAAAFDRYNRQQHLAIVEQLATGLEKLHQGLLPLVDREHSLAELAVRNKLLVDKLTAIRCSEGLCWVHSSATKGNNFILQSIPTDLAPLLKKFFSQMTGAWLFTSATLSVAGNPSRFLSTLDMSASAFYRVSSVFDFSQQARLYTPFISVSPHDENYTDQLLVHLLSLITMTKGRVLCLFSSYRSLNQLAAALSPSCDVPVFVQRAQQGQPKLANEHLIAQFKAVNAGVLLGTGSFWEGLDLSGVPLSAVVIDKLPFASPDDPVVKLRSAELSLHGVDSFEQALLPDAVIRFQQGCGRLLRRLSDRGIIMVADPRLQTKAYGRVFLDSINFSQTNDIKAVAEFIATCTPNLNTPNLTAALTSEIE